MNNIKTEISDKYDAIIIGAGIGGLVCGCYLAKAGMKVLIVEKGDRVGGYCSFLKKDDYKFNLTTCTLGSFRKSGILNKIFYNELNLKDKLRLKRDDPSNTVVTEDGIFDFTSTGKELKESLIKLFPEQKNSIKAFLNVVLSTNPLKLYTKYKNTLFDELLNSFFSDKRLKNFFTIACGIFGTSPYKISAFSALIYYRETIFDGGYYICGGAEGLPETVSEEFIDNGGQILLSAKVVKIQVGQNRDVEGVILENGTYIKTNYLIACCDAKEIFLNLIGQEKLEKKFVDDIRNMSVTSSAFIVYLGLKKPLTKEIKRYKSRNIWFCPGYNVEKSYRAIENDEYNPDIKYLLCYLSSSQDKSSINQISIYTAAPFRDKTYWQENREMFSRKLIENTEQLIPNISDNIKVKLIVTPVDLCNYSLNYKGAIKGWASIPSQNNSRKIPQGAILDNLYIAGQWSTLESGQGGIAMASFTARRAAKLIQKRFLDVRKEVYR